MLNNNGKLDFGEVQEWSIPNSTIYDPKSDRWDHSPSPFKDESFLSWFTRLAKANYSDVDLLYQRVENPNTLKNNNKITINCEIITLQLNSERKNKFLTNLIPFIKIEEKFLDFLRQSEFKQLKQSKKCDYLIIPKKYPNFCPDCLNSDHLPYFRSHWFLRFFVICPEHSKLLRDVCPHCYHPIMYWKTKWDQSVVFCYNCGENLIEGINSSINLEKHIDVMFQKELLLVYQTGYYDEVEIDPQYFFSQLLRLMTIESKDSKLNENIFDEYDLSIERVFNSLIIAYNIIKKERIRLERPFTCQKDNKMFKSKVDLKLHEKTCHSTDFILSKINNREAKRKYEIIAPLLEIKNRKREDIESIAVMYETSVSNVYRYLKSFESDGIEGLVSQRRKRGNRKKRFSDDVENIIYKHLKFNCGCCDKEKSIKFISKKIEKDCIEKGLKIPRYATVTRRVRMPKI